MATNKKQRKSVMEKAGEEVIAIPAERATRAFDFYKGMAQGYVGFAERIRNSLEPLGRRIESLQEQERQKMKELEEGEREEKAPERYALKEIRKRGERENRYREKLDRYEQQVIRFGKQVIPIEDIKEDLYSNLNKIKGLTKNIPYETRETEQFSEIYNLIRHLNKEVRNALNEKYPTHKRKESLEAAREKLNALEESLSQNTGKRTELETVLSVISVSSFLGLVWITLKEMTFHTGYSIFNLTTKPYSLLFLFLIVTFLVSLILLLKSKIKKR